MRRNRKVLAFRWNLGKDDAEVPEPAEKRMKVDWDFLERHRLIHQRKYKTPPILTDKDFEKPKEEKKDEFTFREPKGKMPYPWIFPARTETVFSFPSSNRDPLDITPKSPVKKDGVVSTVEPSTETQDPKADEKPNEESVEEERKEVKKSSPRNFRIDYCDLYSDDEEINLFEVIENKIGPIKRRMSFSLVEDESDVMRSPIRPRHDSVSPKVLPIFFPQTTATQMAGKSATLGSSNTKGESNEVHNNIKDDENVLQTSEKKAPSFSHGSKKEEPLFKAPASKVRFQFETKESSPSDASKESLPKSSEPFKFGINNSTLSGAQPTSTVNSSEPVKSVPKSLFTFGLPSADNNKASNESFTFGSKRTAFSHDPADNSKGSSEPFTFGSKRMAFSHDPTDDSKGSNEPFKFGSNRAASSEVPAVGSLQPSEQYTFGNKRPNISNAPENPFAAPFNSGFNPNFGVQTGSALPGPSFQASPFNAFPGSSSSGFQGNSQGQFSLGAGGSFEGQATGFRPGGGDNARVNKRKMVKGKRKK